MLRRNHIIQRTATRNINADSGCGRKPPDGRRKLMSFKEVEEWRQNCKSCAKEEEEYF